MEKEFYVMSFKSTHYAIMAEAKLKSYSIQMMPTPREITANCGLSLKFDKEDLNNILHEISEWDDYKSMIDIYLLNKESRSIKRMI